MATTASVVGIRVRQGRAPGHPAGRVVLISDRVTHAHVLPVQARTLRPSWTKDLFPSARRVAASEGLLASARAGDQTEHASEALTPRRLAAAASAGAGQVMFLHGVALADMARYVRGDRSTMWSTVER
jgi:hypothetical protein